jgi:hypothetical protein
MQKHTMGPGVGECETFPAERPRLTAGVRPMRARKRYGFKASREGIEISGRWEERS